MRLVVFAEIKQEGQRRALVGRRRARFGQAPADLSGIRALSGGKDCEPRVQATNPRRHDQAGAESRGRVAEESSRVAARGSRPCTVSPESAGRPQDLRDATATRRLGSDRGPTDDHPPPMPIARTAHRSAFDAERSTAGTAGDGACSAIERPRATAGLTTP